MQRRPEVTVYLRPAVATPGESLEVELVLRSPTDTEVDRIDIDLTGHEVVFVPAGNHAQWLQHPIVALRASFPACTLTRGEHRRLARFELPLAAPASYAHHARIEYQLSVHVDIPWWLDRHAAFEVRVGALPGARTDSRPAIYSTHPHGYSAAELVVELSLDTQELMCGSVLSGAVAISNIGAHAITGVHLELSSVEEPSIHARSEPPFASSLPARDAAAFRYPLVDGTPGEAVPHRFAIQIPGTLPATFDAHYFSLRWFLSARVEIRWGADVVIRVPVTITPPDLSTVAQHEPRSAAPLVGRERRALVWGEVAARAQLSNDAAAERMLGRVGLVSFAITLEQRRDGVHTIATLAWPALGLDVELHDRRWTDTLKFGEVFVDELPGAEAFSPRFALFARDSDRARALFADRDTRHALLQFHEVHVVDASAALSARGGASGVDQLGAFVARVQDVAHRLDTAFAERLSPPEAMAHALDAWRALAARLGGRLELGRMWLHDFAVDGERAELGTRWSRDNSPIDTVIHVALSRALDSPLDPSDPALSAPLRALLAGLARDTSSLWIGPTNVELTLPAPLLELGGVEPLLERVAQLVRILRVGRDVGPYR